MKNIILATIYDIKSGNNLDLYLTVIIAVIISFLGALSIAKQEIISSAILATLAILAFGSIQDRRDRSIIRSALKEGSADNFFREYSISQLKDQIETSQSALFWGIHFRQIIPSWRKELTQALKNGARLKVLLIKPDSNAVDMSLLRHSQSNKDDINEYIRYVLKELAYIRRLSAATDSIEVRVIDFLPPWTMVAINPLSRKGKVAIKLSSIRNSSNEPSSFQILESPSFQILADKDRG